jgi:hypothetical protein
MRLFQEDMEALSRGDMEAFLSVVDKDVVWIAARSAVEGAYHGHDGLRKFFADNEENFEVFEPGFREVRDLGDRILVFGTNCGNLHVQAGQARQMGGRPVLKGAFEAELVGAGRVGPDDWAAELLLHAPAGPLRSASCVRCGFFEVDSGRPWHAGGCRARLPIVREGHLGAESVR